MNCPYLLILPKGLDNYLLMSAVASRDSRPRGRARALRSASTMLMC